jgi:hypothetical protein
MNSAYGQFAPNCALLGHRQRQEYVELHVYAGGENAFMRDIGAPGTTRRSPTSR